MYQPCIGYACLSLPMLYLTWLGMHYLLCVLSVPMQYRLVMWYLLLYVLLHYSSFIDCLHSVLRVTKVVHIGGMSLSRTCVYTAISYTLCHVLATYLYYTISSFQIHSFDTQTTILVTCWVYSFFFPSFYTYNYLVSYYISSILPSSITYHLISIEYHQISANISNFYRNE